MRFHPGNRLAGGVTAGGVFAAFLSRPRESRAILRVDVARKPDLRRLFAIAVASSRGRRGKTSNHRLLCRFVRNRCSFAVGEPVNWLFVDRTSIPAEAH